MKIKIQETGKIEELAIVDPKTGVNWVNDLMGNYDELPEYDDDQDLFSMDQNSFDWWKSLTTSLEAAENRYYELSRSSSGHDNLDAERDSFIGNCDLEDLPGALNQFCDQLETGRH